MSKMDVRLAVSWPRTSTLRVSDIFTAKVRHPKSPFFCFRVAATSFSFLDLESLPAFCRIDCAPTPFDFLAMAFGSVCCFCRGSAVGDNPVSR